MFRTVIIYPQPKVQVSGIDESRSTEKAAGGKEETKHEPKQR